jgi:lipoprotein-anchoring transpeptidase ErfK/SrfK
VITGAKKTAMSLVVNRAMNRAMNLSTNRRAVLALVGLAFALAGCAHQPYPPLPDDIGQQPQPGGYLALGGLAPAAGATPAGPASGDMGGDAAVQASAAEPRAGSPANVSEVARREAQMAPVSQKVVPPPPDPAYLPPAETRRLDLHLGSQTFAYYEDDQLVWSGLISSGAAEHPTPRGNFRVTAKDINKRSGSYTNYFDRPTPMPYALQFSGPYWVHEGYVPNAPASHGCVRLRHEDAKFVYARIRLGDPINVIE